MPVNRRSNLLKLNWNLQLMEAGVRVASQAPSKQTAIPRPGDRHRWQNSVGSGNSFLCCLSHHQDAPLVTVAKAGAQHLSHHGPYRQRRGAATHAPATSTRFLEIFLALRLSLCFTCAQIRIPTRTFKFRLSFSHLPPRKRSRRSALRSTTQSAWILGKDSFLRPFLIYVF